MYTDEDKEKNLGRIALLEVDEFVPESFSSTKNMASKIIVDLKKDHIKIPVLEVKNTDDSLFNSKVCFLI